MKKLAFVFFALLILCTPSMAQNKIGLVINDVQGIAEGDVAVNAEFLEVAKRKLEEGADKSGKFAIYDPARFEMMKLQLEDINLGATPEEQISFMKDISNFFQLNGVLTKCQVTKYKNPNGSTAGYSAMITLQISLTNLRGEATKARSYTTSYKDMTAVRRNTAIAAVDIALQSLDNKIAEYFINNVPVEAPVVKMDGAEITLSCGSEQGVKKGDLFNIRMVEGVGETMKETPLCQIRITQLVGDGLAVGRVTSGDATNTNSLFMAAKPLMGKLLIF